MFNPALLLFVHDTKIVEPPGMQPAIDACGRLLVTVFLRRCVTWCARARHYDRVVGATVLYRQRGRQPGDRTAVRPTACK